MTENLLYDYLAATRSYECMGVLQRFGYQFSANFSQAKMGDYLRQFVTEQGRDGLVALAEVHPDRELIRDTAPAEDPRFLNITGDYFRKEDYHNFLGSRTEAQNVNNQTTTFIIAATLLIVTAILIKH